MKKITTIITSLIILVIVAFPSLVSASSLQDQINAINAEIEKNQSVLGGISSQANTLQNKVDGLNVEISQLQSQIDLANLQIQQANTQIEEFKVKLEKQKKIMYENARVLYKEGDRSTLETLFSSDNFSEFVAEQEYLESVKSNVNKAAREVIALKDQLEEKVAELKGFIASQESQRNIIASKRNEQSDLLAQTRGEEANYQNIVNNLKAQQAAAESALAASLSSGSYKVSPVGQVTAGDIIGSMGNTGLSSGPHLHLEVRPGGSCGPTSNPESYIQAQPVQPTIITQEYGNPDPIYTNGCHPGVDYGGGSGMAIHAISSGFLYRGCSDQMLGTTNNAYGYVAIIDHGSYRSIYAHMSGGPANCDYNTY